MLNSRCTNNKLHKGNQENVQIIFEHSSNGEKAQKIKLISELFPTEKVSAEKKITYNFIDFLFRIHGIIRGLNSTDITKKKKKY